MTDFHALDETKLRVTLDALLGVLVDAADGAGWMPDQTAVAVARPGYDCDSIYVWMDLIVPEYVGSPGRCEVLPTVPLRFSLATCFGADQVESAEWWNARAPLYDRLWGTVQGLYVAASDGTLCRALGLPCEDVRVGNVQRVDSADLVAWEGTVSVVLGA